MNRATGSAPAASASEKAYRAIKEAILRNELTPGDPVSVDRFARELELSRTPVREAILRLEREGLIEIRPRLGTFVAQLDLRRIQEMYRVRKVLEGEAAREAALWAPEVELLNLKQTLSQWGGALPYDYDAMSEAGQRVHQLIVRYCGNEVLQNMIGSLQDHFTRFRRLSAALPEKVLSSHREHLAIVDALIARNGPEAQRLVHEHFDHAAQLLLESLLRSAPPAPGGVTVRPR